MGAVGKLIHAPFESTWPNPQLRTVVPELSATHTPPDSTWPAGQVAMLMAETASFCMLTESEILAGGTLSANAPAISNVRANTTPIFKKLSIDTFCEKGRFKTFL